MEQQTNLVVFFCARLADPLHPGSILYNIRLQLVYMDTWRNNQCPCIKVENCGSHFNTLSCSHSCYALLRENKGLGTMVHGWPQLYVLILHGKKILCSFTEKKNLGQIVINS